MGNVRVYELAKEAGMDSKTMTAKLIELGYAIKSHSSSLDDNVVDEIRIKLGLVKTTVDEKRIQRKGQTTIIRRRTRAVKEDLPETEIDETNEDEEEVSVSQDTPAIVEAPSPVEVEKHEVVEPPAVPQGEVVETPPVVVVHKEKEIEAITEPEAPAPVISAVDVPEEKAVETDSPEPAVDETPAEPPAAVITPIPVKRVVIAERPQKGIARVIKRAAIHIPQEEEPSRERPRRPAPVKGRVVRDTAATPGQRPAPAAPRPPRTDGAVAATPGSARDDAAKGKKGKRYVKFQAEPDTRDRGRKGVTKHTSKIVVDVDDVEGLNASALPASLRMGRSYRSGGKKGKKMVSVSVSPGPKAIKKRIKVTEYISVGDLAHRMGVKASEIISKLMSMGIMATVNQSLDVDTATLISDEFGYEIEQVVTEEQVFEQLEVQESGGEEESRPPVVTVMGHVDHGKTSILDAIRQTDVAAGEAGGITQHIGAHYVRSSAGDVVFLDTPGHAAFTEMRSRGAKVTDVVVLVVAADDGVMEQTKEAINHARAAEVPIVVAVNKIDKPNADVMRVMRELSEFGLVPEEWGGDTIYCQTSAKQGVGIQELLEQILLQAEILELKADSNRKARGHVIEAQLHKGRGPVATVLVQHGTLRVGDCVVVGQYYGKVRSLFSDKGTIVKEAGPSVPVEIHGLSGVPSAGDEFIVVADEKMAKSISADRQMRYREVELASSSKISLANLFEKLKEGETKELRVLLRSDVQGTLEAFGKAIENLSTNEIKVKILHEGTGTITDSDILLAAASNAIIIGFNVRPSTKVADFAKNENVDIRFYDVIYHALEDIKLAMVGLLDPTFEENVIGSVEIRQTFSVPKIGTIAGCYVTDGKIERNAKVRVIRDGVVVHTGKLSSLKRFKDDAKEVATGYECGIGIENFNDLRVDDVLEVFVMKEVAAEL